MSPELPKMSFDLEMTKRQAVAAEDFDDAQSYSQLEGVGGLERCGTQPSHRTWDLKDNWEINPDIRVLAAEFSIQRGMSPAESQKINGVP